MMRAVLGGLFALASFGVGAELPVDKVGTMDMPAVKNRIYVADIAINHIADGRLHLVDADKGRYLGLIGTGFAGHSTQSPDGKTLYVSTTYLSRLQRGERTDVVEVYDADTLVFKHEIRIDSKRTQALNYRGYLRTSSDGRLLYVQNATPATSITVVDLEAKKQIGEIDAPGCWGIYPSGTQARRVSTLCGDGTIATFTLAQDGQPKKEGGRANSGKLFDGDADAWFTHAEQSGDTYHFLSYRSVLTQVDLGGEAAKQQGQWRLVGKGKDVAGWRPGGYQPFAINPKAGRLYVSMHGAGKEGSHKTPAQQIWVYDLAGKRLQARKPGQNAIALTTPASGDAMVYAIDGVKNGLVVMAGATLQARHRIVPIGTSSIQLESR